MKGKYDPEEMMPYQSFVDQPGDSKSEEKLYALRLPASMQGQSFLDIGCNEGFFCMEAKRRGAKIVIGIDKEAEFINKARQRAIEAGMDITYICDTWDNLPTGTFDFILVASSLHYVTSPLSFFDTIYDHLTDNGVLILECGYTAEIVGPAIRRVTRMAGACFYPRQDVLINHWLRRFSIRGAGWSVMQAGDPLPRGVFHCRKWHTTVMFIPGEADTGKSGLASKLTSTENIIKTDRLFFSRSVDEAAFIPEDIKYLACFQSNGRDIFKTWNELQADTDVINHFADILLKAIFLYRGTDVVIVEGYILQTLLPIIYPILKNEGFRCWTILQGQA